MKRTEKKDAVPMSFRLDSEIAGMLGKRSAETGASMTYIVEQALREYFEKDEAHSRTDGRRLRHTDIMNDNGGSSYGRC